MMLVALMLLLSSPASADLAVVLNSLDDDVSLVDTTTYQQVKRFRVGKEPHHLMATPDDRYLIVANAMSNDLVFLDPKTGDVVRRVPRISDPYQIGFSPDRRWFVATSLRLDRVDIYRFEGGEFTLAGRLPVGRAPSHLAFSADSRTAYVTVQDSHQIVAVDLERQRLRWTAATGRQPAGIWVTPGDARLLIGLTGSDAVAVHDVATGKELKRLVTGKGAHNFLPMGDGRRLLLSNRVANTVSIIDQQELKVVDTIAVPGGPDCMELRRDGKELWVTSRWINRVSVIDMDTKRLVHSIPVGRSPHGIYFPAHAARQ
jgi:YVTN family beta-propeller protein